MAEKWRRYETLIIFDPESGTEATEGLIRRARDYVTMESGRILKTERWGLRDLAFEVKGRRKGYYLLMEFAGLPRAATELDRRLNMIDAVVKFQTIKLEEEVDPATLPEAEEVISEPAGAPPEAVAPLTKPPALEEEEDEEMEPLAESDDSEEE
jgi:small subunit ribosomal protein S6